MSAVPDREPEVESDEDLMSRTSSGDLQAFGLLVERHHERALNFAYRLCGDPELAGDVSQECFLRLWKGARRYRPTARFTTYLFAVVRNLVREMKRAQRRRREEPLDGGGDSRSDPATPSATENLVAGHDPGVALEHAELRDRLIAALQALPEKLRQVFVMSELEGLPYREIARLCGCPMGTIASRKHEAVMRLRAILAPLRSES
jgi:RNA polymerase sigma-70 factor (ECF subfamily)